MEKILNTGTLDDLMNAYNQADKTEKLIKLNFKTEETLHTTRYIRDDVTAQSHIVRGLFFLNAQGYGNMEKDGDKLKGAKTAYYVPKGKRSRGFSMDWRNLESIEIIEDTGKVPEKVKWQKGWTRIAKSLRKYNINPYTAYLIETALRVGYDAMQELVWKKESYDYSEEGKERYKASVAEWCEQYSVKDDEVHDLLWLGTQNYTMAHAPRIAKVERITADEIMEMIKNVKPGDAQHVSRRGQKRDMSVNVAISNFQKGGISASYASEYAGCGNGAYYILFSPTQAFYSEHD